MEEGLRLVHVDALAGELDRRLEELSPRQRPVAAVRGLEAGHQTGHGDRLLADVEHLRRGVAEVDHELLHLGERARRHGEEAVEHDAPRRPRNEEEAAAGRPRERALGDEGRKHSSDTGVDRVAALCEYGGTQLRP